MATSSHLIVAAFDFGTTYSGYAFSFKEDPSKVQTNSNWYAGNLVSLKTSTTVLLTPDGAFHSFGFDAEDQYSNLSIDKNHQGWRLFRRFKMVLHGGKNISRSSTVEDIQGFPHPAMEIFTMAIRFLREHLLKALMLQKTGISESDITYILTVPAIWDDMGKQFMREAAVEAGIDDGRLKLALEPEAAAIWCERLESSLHGDTFMVLDLGGGTADISVHERRPGGTMKIIRQASGGPWGGIYVDDNFVSFLSEIFGEQTMSAMKTEEMFDYFDIVREFETKKRTFHGETDAMVTFQVPVSARALSEKLTTQNLGDRLEAYRKKHGHKIILRGDDKLSVQSIAMRSWFDGSLSKLIEHMKSVLKEPNMKGISSVLLVGGFGESEYVRQKIRSGIPGMQLVVPSEAGLAVLKGAVMFGHNPSIVTSRVMPFTYGVAVQQVYDAKKHRGVRNPYNDPNWLVPDCFEVYVRVNEEVAYDQKVTHLSTPSALTSAIPVYRTLQTKPLYITDPGCEHLGTLYITNSCDVPFEEQEQEVTFQFGDTELLVTCKPRGSEKEEKLTLDCLV
ncbi:heat shock 70 kDa protein 12B-like [Dreissena polymorpha]|uniref:Uncharacterized protein n=1 Tax=Dreissena polymorpha TaxID=45954 RepID=A0A9D4E5P7_DREPO|nr:heat shock 70 kDa protein 12B-like [Dreissena polymorpha]XP_052233637.1 heat shock 70 kDa protein 12B-like [Dreissena polymorpha]XP_052233638.1 heat shock 70 kDa protein 12B-like [Dreissena polymorpha]KAH3774354.1 hypothetical protein DPMN_175735 [Dreissena polymorpha]